MLYQTDKAKGYLLEIALAEKLDEFLEIENNHPDLLEYFTVHGSRTLSSTQPELNLFLILTKGSGFARAVAMPYVRSYNYQLGIPQLIVEYSQPDAPATIAGYARAVPLSEPCFRDGVWIENLGMLDTDYAALLLDGS